MVFGNVSLEGEVIVLFFVGIEVYFMRVYVWENYKDLWI